MAKVQCSFCGGSHDGTPSGERKHVATSKHQAAMEQFPETFPAQSYLQPEPKTAEELLAALALPWKRNEDGTYQDIHEMLSADEEYRAAALAASLYRKEAGDAEDALERRQADLKWRRTHRPDEADAYEAKKVTPLVEKIAAAEAAQAPYEEAMRARRAVVEAPIKQFYVILVEAIEALDDMAGLQVRPVEEYGVNIYHDALGTRSVDVKYPRLTWAGRKSSEGAVFEDAEVSWWSGSRAEVAELDAFAKQIRAATSALVLINLVFGK